MHIGVFMINAENIKISVVMPIYNASDYLKPAIDSVLNQTLSDIELICVDDGSTDNSLSILKEYQNTDDRIRILKKQNSPINDDPVFTRLSSGIVTLGDKMNAINMILLSKKYVRFQSGLNIIETISMAVGAILSAILAIAGFGILPSVLVALWPVVWSTLIWSISKKIFHITKKKQK